jgi:hypothetical protein
MRKQLTILAALLLAIAVSAASQTSTGKAKPKIFAQKLVDKTITKHPEVVILAFHVTPPGKSDNVIIASNIGRIGKKADDDDMRVINTGKSNLEVNVAGNHFEVELVILDQSGRTVGAAGVVFNYKEGDDQKALEKKAEQIRDEWTPQIPNKEALFAPVS